jgi:sodium/potassium-transporting ATPase subunit alpha
MDPEEKSNPRVRFGELRLPDEEEGYVTHDRRHAERSRRSSTGSLSIHSTGGTRTVQPETALPITYRTLSIEIDEGRDKKQAEVKKAKEKAAVDLADLEWHTITVHELTRRLSVETDYGLSDDQIKRRLIEHGQNKMTPPKSGLLGKIIGYFFGGFGSILVVAGILVFVSWRPLGDPPAMANLALACVLIAVWLIQAAFNAWQDWSTSRVMASIGTMLPDQ